MSPVMLVIIDSPSQDSKQGTVLNSNADFLECHHEA